MALDPATTIIPGRGTVFVAPVGTAVPTLATVDPTQASSFTTWDCIGHTSRDNTVSLNKDGGDVNTLGSWWDSALRTTVDPVTWSLTFNSLQMDKLTLGLAFGGGTAASGKYTIPSSSATVSRALYVLMVDGTGRMAIHCPKTDITLGDAPEVAVDGFFEVQLRATVLVSGSTLMEWYHPAISA